MSQYDFLLFSDAEMVSRSILGRPQVPLRVAFAQSIFHAVEILKTMKVQTLVYEPSRSSNREYGLLYEIQRHKIQVPILALTADAALAKSIGASAFIDPDLFFRKVS